jgi:hypothetical protein
MAKGRKEERSKNGICNYFSMLGPTADWISAVGAVPSSKPFHTK